MNSFLKQLSEYRYPSVDELEDIQNKSPDLNKFGFFENDVLPAADVDFVEHKKISDVYNWDKILGSKIIDLQTSYVYTLVHYNRGIPLTSQEYIDQPFIRPNYDNLKFYITYLHYCINC
jgi:hypothetical protein